VPQGTIKEFDKGSRTGILYLDDESEVQIDASSVEGADIQHLRIGQRVKFDLAEEGGRRLARVLRIVTFE